MVGYPTLAFVFIGWYAGVRIGYGKYRLPEAVTVTIVGVVLGWATGLNEAQDVVDASLLVGWWPPRFTAGDLFANFSLVSQYLGIVIPLGISAATSTLMRLVSAKEAGDPFPIRENYGAFIVSTSLSQPRSATFGSPFGTSVYIGQPAHKKSGAQVGYTLLDGIYYVILSWSGLIALIQSIVNMATIGPVVFFVGVLINEEALVFIPSRHFVAYVVGILPPIYEWAISALVRTPIADTTSTYNANYPSGSTGFIGIYAWSKGSLLISMIWTAMMVMIVDRKWTGACLWSLIGAAFAVVGIIHVPIAGFEAFASPTWEQCSASNEDTPTCWENAQQWMFFVAYLMLAVIFAILQVFRRFRLDSTLKEPFIDATAFAFNNWFRDAANSPHADETFSALFDSRSVKFGELVHCDDDLDGEEESLPLDGPDKDEEEALESSRASTQQKPIETQSPHIPEVPLK